MAIIKPSSVLRNYYKDISDLAHETEEAIYITKHGTCDVVVMSIEAFEARDEDLLLQNIVIGGEKSRLFNEDILDLDEVYERLKAKFIV